MASTASSPYPSTVHALTPDGFAKLQSDVEEIATQQENSNQEFHRFAKLPQETRLQIWEAALPGPRIVEMRVSARHWIKQYDFVCRDKLSVGGSPTILRVCRESRLVALERYSLAFYNPKCSIPIYFNFEVDILYLRAEKVHDGKCPDAIKILPNKDEVKRIALSPQSFRDHGVELLLEFPRLEEAIVLLLFGNTLGNRGFVHAGRCEAGYSCFPRMEEIFFFNIQAGLESARSQQVISTSLSRLLSEKKRNANWKGPMLTFLGFCDNGVDHSNRGPPRNRYSCPNLAFRKRFGMTSKSRMGCN